MFAYNMRPVDGFSKLKGDFVFVKKGWKFV
jgi:hypothetical protein